MVRRPFGMFGSSRETLREVRKWSGDPPRGLEVVGRPFKRSEVVGRPSKWSEVVGRPYERSGSGRETLQEVWKLSVDPTGRPEVVKRPSRRSGSGVETLREV